MRLPISSVHKKLKLKFKIVHVQVFADAALDYVTCLLHHVRGSEERQQLEELISIRDVDRYLSDGSADLTLAALHNLVRVHDVLRRMHKVLQ